MSVKSRDPISVVTGATSGIGFALVKVLLARGLSVIGVGRSTQRCDESKRWLRGQFPGSQVSYCVADLSLLSEVRDVAGEIGLLLNQREHPGLDALVNNAGAFTFWRTQTEEGFETQWALNHLAPFLLTHLLLPQLQKAPQAKVITVSSGSHRNAAVDWDDLQLERFYNPLRAYKQTKLANVLFTFELNRRLGSDSSVHAFAADPGLVNTGMGEKTGSRLAAWYWRRRRRKGIPAEESASGIASLLMNPGAGQTGEIYWKHGAPIAPDPQGLDPVASKRLWQISASMCGLEA